MELMAGRIEYEIGPIEGYAQQCHAASIALVTREPWLTARPRLYEHGLAAPDAQIALKPVLELAGVTLILAEVAGIDLPARRVGLADGRSLAFGTLVLAAGSVARPPAIDGFAEHGHGVDTWAYGNYPGNYGVYVDRYSGRARRYFPDPGNDTITNGFMQNWAGAIHMGTLVGWLPRTGWILFGLTPLLLAVTGTVTWVMRRRMGRRKKRRGRDRDGGSGPGAPSPVGVPAGAEA